MTAWPPTATPSWASSPTARTAVVTISVPPGGAPPASSGVAQPAGGGSSRAAAACCGASGAAASFRCAEARGFAAELRAFVGEADLAAPPDFAPDFLDDVDFGFAADLRAEEDFADVVFAEDDFADVFALVFAADFGLEVDALDFAADLGFEVDALDFAADFGFAADLRPEDDFAGVAFPPVDFVVEELDFAEAGFVAAFPPDFPRADFAPPDALAVALPEPARFAERDGRAAAFGSSPDAGRERASSRALPSRLLERLTRRERGRLEKTSPLDSSAIGRGIQSQVAAQVRRGRHVIDTTPQRPRLR